MTTRAETLPDDLSPLEARILGSITEQRWLDLACTLIPAGQPDAENPLDPDEPNNIEITRGDQPRWEELH